MRRSVIRIEKEQNDEEQRRIIDDEHWVLDIPELQEKEWEILAQLYSWCLVNVSLKSPEFQYCSFLLSLQNEKFSSCAVVHGNMLLLQHLHNIYCTEYCKLSIYMYLH